ncbi:hypothetical protein OIE43_41775 [Streptomyces pseudovenezuelae]|uniref:hypothetical protein n=1 Tax=Streptomyces pseudovenezuelae TaxID=67350 RepID=UPI002E33F499|nr:hypothetical protein [Streptomyces pseudovenezuelae]
MLFRRDAWAYDRSATETAYRATTENGEEILSAWIEYHWAVLLDNIDEDAAGALPRFETAPKVATKSGDAPFEVDIIGHLAPHKEPADRLTCSAARSTCAR